MHLPNIPMKLCDLKPFYGIIHRDLLEKNNYEWWGFGDIDVAYGDLTPMVKLSRNSMLDVITTHIKCIAGHFTLIRTASNLTTIVPKFPK